MSWSHQEATTEKVRAQSRAGSSSRQQAPERPNDRRERKPAKLLRTHKPADMSLEEWQVELRRQFGRKQRFRLRNLGDDAVFSEFEVLNPDSHNSYRVHIRGAGLGDNFCSCPDFATNTLGTCKHIEFTLAVLERKRGALKRLQSGYQPDFSEVYLQYGAQREVRFRPGADCPVELARLASKYFTPQGALQPEAFGEFESFLQAAGELDHELRCHDDALAFIAAVRDGSRRGQVVDDACKRGSQSSLFKGLLKVDLYDYQREGILFATRAGRCLIGDEMGLGKTIQAIGCAELMARLFGIERVLVICPTSLKHQWQREIEKFVDRTAQVVVGLRDSRELQFRTESFFKIINYDTVHRDLDLISGWGPDLVILDEAQRIKNWNTRVARAVKRIQSTFALVLTGTPLENRLEELISIIQFVDRHRLGATFRLLDRHQVKDQHGKVVGYQDLDQIGTTLAPVLIRRQKDQVLDQLPERIDNTIFVPMTPLQKRYHEEGREIVARIVDKWRRYKFLSETDQQRLMMAMQRMRMSCDSSYLVDHKSDEGPKADEVLAILEELFEERGAKVVVFSQWLRMHELIVRRLQARELQHVVFHGGVPGQKRKELIDRFRDEAGCRAFLSTDAGGVGLNLQHASVVVNMDLPWNPAVLEQRVGRVHRLGQRQPVRVINFVAKGTIEEGMLSILKFKKSLFAGVLDGGEKNIFLGGSKLNRFMESVEKATEAIPASVLDEEDASGETVFDADDSTDADTERRGRRRRGEDRQTPPRERVEQATGQLVTADPWAGLLETGIAVLQQLATGASRPESASSRSGGVSSFVRQDQQTGETYLKFPMPKPEVLNQALRALAGLMQSLRG